MVLVPGLKNEGQEGQNMERLPKRIRQQRLTQIIEENPFMTDEELTKQFHVSIQTIRLDRLELGIPEWRERLKSMAENSYDQVRSLSLNEVIGELVDLQLDKSAISILEIGNEHVFSRTNIARGHYLFAQANSLAVAVINEEMALTTAAEIRFLRPVKLSEKCICKAYVRLEPNAKVKVNVDVMTYVRDEPVFQGHFVVYRKTKDVKNEGGV
jgi:acyl-coenzyme A thioesterase PaaI-like protein